MMKQYMSTEAVVIWQYMTSQYIHEATLYRHSINATVLRFLYYITYCSIMHYICMYTCDNILGNEKDATQSVFHGSIRVPVKS